MLPPRMIRNKHLPFIEIKKGIDTAYAARKHSHQELSLGFVEKGSSRISCSTLAVQMVPGDGILIPPDTIHFCDPAHPGTFKFTVIHIKTDWFKHVFEMDAASLVPMVRHLPADVLWMKNHFLKKFQCACDPTALESHAIFFINTLIVDEFGQKRRRMQNRATDGLSRVKDFIDDHFCDPIALEDLCDFTGQNKYALLRNFNAAYQLTPHAYIMNARINYGRRLLKDGATVAQTAVECGFFDQSHFVKTFKRFVGLTPEAYR